MTESDDNKDRDIFSEITLDTLHHEGRDIAYSTSPRSNDELTPVLFFYPAGGNRRMLYSFRNLLSDLFFVCVNRPGTGGTSPAKESGARAHLDTTICDAVAVLDQLGIHRVTLVYMCAGAPFCLSFAARYPERTTGQIIGISSWVQPADCGYENTKTSFYLGTNLRPLAAPVAGLVFASIGSSLSSFPTSMTLGALRRGLSEDECVKFDEKYNNPDEFLHMMKWMQQENGRKGRDVSVLLSANLVDYQAVVDSQDSIILFHGTNDKLVPFASAEWLASDEALEGATLNAIPGGTHEGGNFLFYSSIVDSLKKLGQSQTK